MESFYPIPSGFNFEEQRSVFNRGGEIKLKKRKINRRPAQTNADILFGQQAGTKSLPLGKK
jgi:hypothetical protein